MPYFSYTAKDRFGGNIKGALEAADERELARKLREDEKFLITAALRKETRSEAGGSKVKMGRSGTRIKKEELVTFSSHLATAFSAGIPILEALEGYAKRTRNLPFRGIIQDIHDGIRGGARLSDSLSAYPGVFSRMYVNIVRVGERVGNIEELLRNLVDFIEWQRELERDVKKLVTYPALVLTAIFGIIVALVTFVYPRIGSIFSKMNVNVPITTRWLLSLSNLVKGNIAIEVTIIILLIGGYQFLKRTSRGALFIDAMKLKVPIIGAFRVKAAISRFTHHLEIMQRAGVDISQSLQIATEAIDNRILAGRLSGAREKIIAGQSLSDALSETGIFPDLVIRMVAMGELGGSMEDNLKKVSQYYDKEVPAAVKKTLMVIEPILILFLAGAVLFIAVSLYLPIYRLIDSIKFQR